MTGTEITPHAANLKSFIVQNHNVQNHGALKLIAICDNVSSDSKCFHSLPARENVSRLYRDSFVTNNGFEGINLPCVIETQ